MISIDMGKLTIPEEERFIGFTGDNTTVTKEMIVRHRAVLNSEYTLCLRFDNGTVRTVQLDSRSYGSDTLLVWKIESEDLLAHGVVTAQLRITDSSGNVQHTTKDYFYIGSSVELNDGGEEIEHITRSQLEQAVRRLRSESPYVGDDGFWYVYDRARERFFKTGYRAELRVDDGMDASSPDPVTNRAITAYIDDVLGDIESLLAKI